MIYANPEPLVNTQESYMNGFPVQFLPLPASSVKFAATATEWQRIRERENPHAFFDRAVQPIPIQQSQQGAHGRSTKPQNSLLGAIGHQSLEQSSEERRNSQHVFLRSGTFCGLIQDRPSIQERFD